MLSRRALCIMENRLSCEICLTNKSKYSCPRCHIAYCSVSCYQSDKHLECSEIFFKQWVHEEMKNHHADPEAQRRILELLRSNPAEENLDSDDEEAVSDLGSRMANVNLDDEEAVWEKLTVEERQEFKKLVATGDIIKMMPDWEPWWETKKKKIYVADCGEDDWRSKCPSVPSDIPELPKLTTVNPSPNVRFMLLNVLLSYVFSVRWFKGAHNVLPVEAISMCISLSATLRDSKVFRSPFESFLAFERDLSECEWIEEDGINMHIIREGVHDIINGSDGKDLFFCLKAALCDLNSLCSQAVVILKAKNNHLLRFSGPLPKVSLLQQISRKISYYLSWSVSHGNLLYDICLD